MLLLFFFSISSWIAFGMASRVSPIGECYQLVQFAQGATALMRVTAWPLSGESDG